MLNCEPDVSTKIRLDGKFIYAADLSRAATNMLCYKFKTINPDTGLLECNTEVDYISGLHRHTDGVAGLLTKLRINKDNTFTVGFVNYPHRMLRLSLPERSLPIEMILLQHKKTIMITHNLLRLEALLHLVDFTDKTDKERIDYLFHSNFQEILCFIITPDHYRLSRRLTGRLVNRICHVIGLGHGNKNCISICREHLDYIRVLLYPHLD